MQKSLCKNTKRFLFLFIIFKAIIFTCMKTIFLHSVVFVCEILILHIGLSGKKSNIVIFLGI